MAKKIGYNVYHAPEGSSESFCGFATNLKDARKLATGGGLPEYQYGTARAAGHVCGMTAPDKSCEGGEPVEWFGRRGEYCAVAVYDAPVEDCEND